MSFSKTVIALFVLMQVGLLQSAEILRMKNGRTVEGNLRYVVDKYAYVTAKHGGMYKVPMSGLEPASERVVKSWISQQGGTESYTSWVKINEAEFSKPWPGSVFAPLSMGITSVTADSKKGYYVSESNHYRFISDTKIDTRVVKHFAVLFETTRKFVMALPLNASAHYLEKGTKHQVYLFGSYGNYIRAGGANGSSGVYIPSTQVVLVPLEALGVVRQGSKFVIKKGESNKVLAHEITHQLTAGVNFAPWYLEGSAEYVAATKYTHGTYHAAYGKNRIFDYVKNEKGLKDGSGRRLGTRIKMMPLEQFMALNYDQFTGAGAAKNYGVGLLLTYYFYFEHGARDGKAIKEYVKALQKGVREKEARKILLESRTYQQLQDDFERYCHSGGFAIDFQ